MEQHLMFNRYATLTTTDEWHSYVVMYNASYHDCVVMKPVLTHSDEFDDF